MNFKKHTYPTDTTELSEMCKNIATDFDIQLKSGTGIMLNDVYRMVGNRCTADRQSLRSLFECNSTNRKYSGKEIKGVYVLVNETNKPYYVGISQTIIRRLKQHVFGKSHNHATLTYLIAKHDYQNVEDKVYIGARSDLQYFTKHREGIQEKLRNSRVLIKEIDNNFVMHAAEVYLACHYKCYWNCFETH